MFHLSKKILIGISLILSFIFTLGLGTILTPPYPRISNLISLAIKISRYRSGFGLSRPTLPNISSTPVDIGVLKPQNRYTPAPSNIPAAGTAGRTGNSRAAPTAVFFPTAEPTSTPKPTNTPRPTKPPKPTPTPTIKLEALRPGKNFQDAANIIQPIICIPQAMIMATLDNEYGPWMDDVEADWINKNTYHGSDPHNNPGSTKVVSVMQMMEDTWSRIKPIVSQKFGGAEMSIAVTFDAMAAGGYHLRNVSLAMQDKISCDDWPVKYILYGACRYNGACAPGAATYNQYAYDVCNAYNRYTKGPKKNCQ